MGVCVRTNARDRHTQGSRIDARHRSRRLAVLARATEFAGILETHVRPARSSRHRRSGQCLRCPAPGTGRSLAAVHRCAVRSGACRAGATGATRRADLRSQQRPARAPAERLGRAHAGGRRSRSQRRAQCRAAGVLQRSGRSRRCCGVREPRADGDRHRRAARMAARGDVDGRRGGRHGAGTRRARSGRR